MSDDEQQRSRPPGEEANRLAEEPITWALLAGAVLLIGLVLAAVKLFV